LPAGDRDVGADDLKPARGHWQRGSTAVPAPIIITPGIVTPGPGGFGAARSNQDGRDDQTEGDGSWAHGCPRCRGRAYQAASVRAARWLKHLLVLPWLRLTSAGAGPR